MILIIQNNLNIPRSYVGGSVSVDALGSYTSSASVVYPLSRDPLLILDCDQGNVLISDGSTIYELENAIVYLNQIAASIGGAVVGLVGSTAPSYAIMVGSKDQNGNIQAATISSAGAISITGDVASGSADSGNPIKIGSVYNSSLPTPSSTDRVDVQSNQFGEVSVQFRNKFRNLTGNATTTVKSGSGRLHAVMVNKNWTGGTAVIYDNTAGSGTVIATLDFGSPSGGLLSTSGMPGPCFLGPLGLEFSTGLTVVLSGSSSNNITILYQ